MKVKLTLNIVAVVARNRTGMSTTRRGLLLILSPAEALQRLTREKINKKTKIAFSFFFFFFFKCTLAAPRGLHISLVLHKIS